MRIDRFSNVWIYEGYEYIWRTQCYEGLDLVPLELQLDVYKQYQAAMIQQLQASSYQYAVISKSLQSHRFITKIQDLTVDEEWGWKLGWNWQMTGFGTVGMGTSGSPSTVFPYHWSSTSNSCFLLQSSHPFSFSEVYVFQKPFQRNFCAFCILHYSYSRKPPWLHIKLLLQ
jgi:hypothetical protein